MYNSEDQTIGCIIFRAHCHSCFTMSFYHNDKYLGDRVPFPDIVKQLTLVKQFLADPDIRHELCDNNLYLLDELIFQIDFALRDPAFQLWCEGESDKDIRYERYYLNMGPSYVYSELDRSNLATVYIKTLQIVNIYKPGFSFLYCLAPNFYTWCHTMFECEY